MILIWNTCTTPSCTCGFVIFFFFLLMRTKLISHHMTKGHHFDHKTTYSTNAFFVFLEEQISTHLWVTPITRFNCSIPPLTLTASPPFRSLGKVDNSIYRAITETADWREHAWLSVLFEQIIHRPVRAMVWAWLPCRSDDGARTRRLPLTHNPPAFYSCFSWTYLHLFLNPPGLSCRKQQQQKLIFRPPPPLKPPNACLSSVRGDRADAPLKRAPLVGAAADPRSFPWRTRIIHSERCRELVGRKAQHFSDDAHGFRQCVWSVRFYAVSTTWTPSHRSSHVPPAPIPSELPW